MITMMKLEHLSEEELESCAREKAEFCIVTGIAPSEYDKMTGIELEQFTKVWNKIHKK